MDPRRLKARVEFVGARSDFEGNIALLEGWIYLTEEKEYVPRHKIESVFEK